MEGGFREDGFARQQGLGYGLSNRQRPIVKLVFAVCKSNQKAGISDADQGRLNPLRWDKSFGPSTVPAKDMNAREGAPLRAFSRWSLMIWLCDMPRRRAFSRSQSARSSGSRTVTVLLIWQKCSRSGCFCHTEVSVRIDVAAAALSDTSSTSPHAIMILPARAAGRAIST